MVRQCGCGRVYNLEAWNQLKDSKEWWVEPGIMAEQRLCPCGSHISIEVPMVIIIGIESGRFRVSVGNKVITTDTNSKALAQAFEELGFLPKEHYMMCSSSIDFPEDDGASGLNARKIIQEASALLMVKA